MRQMIIFSVEGNNRVMKNHLVVIAVIFIIMAFTLTLTACNLFPMAMPEDIFNSVVRIHIRANSNADIDQAVKLKVRDEITAYLSVALQNCRTKNEALSVINANATKLEEIANNTLYCNDFDYSSAVFVGKSYFPEREYDGYIFPEGQYDALIIELGSGTGDNWWCVAFPPLCFVPDNGEGEIVYKSWVKELLDEIFG